MSAVIEATSVRPEADRYYELGLSLFHAQALASQLFADGRGQWLAAVRRSNLDEVADFVESEIGEASYVDGFGRVDYEFSPRTRGRLHVLMSADSAEVTNAAETEFAEADYRNSYFWATLEHDFSDAVAGSAILSYTRSPSTARARSTRADVASAPWTTSASTTCSASSSTAATPPNAGCTASASSCAACRPNTTTPARCDSSRATPSRSPRSG